MTAAPPALVEILQSRYAFERELGSGGMATVYLARDLRDGSLVAVKVLRQYLVPHYGAERFAREIRITAGLRHPNILPLLESGHAGEVPFFVAPYVAGGSLAERLTREVQLPIPDAIGIACDIAEALGAAHAHGVVHRDIKPSNILLAPGRAMLADFGIARAMDVAAGEKLTETGLALGTPHYMSPEQFSGGAVDGRSDIYSLACVLFEMLAGGPPFPGPTPQAIQARHFTDPVPSLQTVRQTVSPALEQVITTALAKVPADRQSSAQDFKRALLSLGAVDSQPATPRPVRRRRGSLALALTGVLVPAAALGLLAVWPVPGASVRLEADVTRVGMTLPSEQALGDPLEVTSVGVSGVSEVDIPSGRFERQPVSTEKLLLAALEEPFRTGRLTLPLGTAFPAGTEVSLAALEDGTYELTVGDSIPELALAAVGPVGVVLPGASSERVDFPAPSVIRLRPGSVVGFEFEPAPSSPRTFAEDLPVAGLDLTRIDRFESESGTRLREVSTIRRGRLLIAGAGERALRGEEELRAAGVRGVITRLELAPGHLRLQVRARVSQLSIGSGSERRSLLPSALAWLVEEHPWPLIGTLALYLATLVLATLLRRRRV